MAEKPQTRRRKSLSDKQLKILEVIQTSIARHGYPPSMREIGDAVGLKSLSSVTHQLNQLELSQDSYDRQRSLVAPPHAGLHPVVAGLAVAGHGRPLPGRGSQ